MPRHFVPNTEVELTQIPTVAELKDIRESNFDDACSRIAKQIIEQERRGARVTRWRSFPNDPIDAIVAHLEEKGYVVTVSGTVSCVELVIAWTFGPNMLKFEAHNFVKDSDFDELVIETYGRPYCFQQQEGCRDRGIECFTIPISGKPYDYEQDQIPEVINGEEMGVSFAAWLARDPKAPVKDEEGGGTEDWEIEMFWQRNFYPSIETVVQDLYERGLIPAGKYIINIDW